MSCVYLNVLEVFKYKEGWVVVVIVRVGVQYLGVGLSVR